MKKQTFKEHENFKFSEKSRAILQRYADTHPTKDKTDTIEKLLEEFDAFTHLSVVDAPKTETSHPQPEPSQKTTENSSGQNCAQALVVLPQTRKATEQEKAEWKLDVLRRKRLIDIEAKVELAERLAKIRESNRPMRRATVEFPENGGSPKIADGFKKTRFLSDTELREMRDAFFPSAPTPQPIALPERFCDDDGLVKESWILSALSSIEYN